MGAETQAGSGWARRRRVRGAAAGVGVVLLALFLYWLFYARYYAVTDDAYVTGDLVPVEAQTAGTAQAVWVRRTEFVHKGEPLAILQGDRARIALHRARARLGATVRHVRALFADVQALDFTLTADRWRRARLIGDLARYRRSLAAGAVSAIRVADTRMRLRALDAQIKALRAQRLAQETLVAARSVARNPLVRAAAAQVAAADLAWQRRVIRAPIAGFIGARAVYPGTLVHSGERLFTIVPLDDLWVVANIKETRMRAVRPGQRVTLTSAYYGRGVVYQGRVLGLAPGAGSAFSILPPDNATGNYIHIVERVPVRIGLDPRALRAHPLRPGLSMTVQVRVHRHGRSVLAPLTAATASHETTPIYTGELRKAQAVAGWRPVIASAGGGSGGPRAARR